MSTVFDNLINDYLEATGGVEDEIIKALKKLKQEVGDISDFEAQALIRQLFGSIKETEKADESERTTRPQQQAKTDLATLDKKILEANIETIKKYLDKKMYNYEFAMLSDATACFIVKPSEDNSAILTYIYVCKKPHHCELRAYYPFDSKADMIYPLCETMIKRNREYLYGDLQLSENGKDIYSHYCFRTANGINIDDFNLYFHSVTNIAGEYFAEIKNICECNFNDDEKDEIIDNLKNLAEAIVHTD